MAQETKDKHPLIVDRVALAKIAEEQIGYCQTCKNIIKPFPKREITVCSNCGEKVYGWSIALDNGIIIKEGD